MAHTVEDIHGKQTRTLINVPTRRSQIVAALASATRKGDAIEIDVKTDFSKGDVFVFAGKDGEPQRLEVQDGGQLCGSLNGLADGALMRLGVEIQGVRDKQLMPLVANEKGLLVLDHHAKEPALVTALAGATFSVNEFPDHHYRSLSFMLQMNNNRTNLDVRIPLPKDGEPFKLLGDTRLPAISTIRDVIPRVVTFAKVVAMSGGRVGHPADDGASSF